MKLLRSPNGPQLLKPGWTDNLFNRVVLVGDPKESVVPVLDKWVEEGKPLNHRNLRQMVKQMVGFKRFSHALQISNWMSDRRYLPLSPHDIADRVELLGKIHGVEHAENYFNNIPKQMKASQPYRAILNCYAEAKAVEKAEALFDEIEELKLHTSSSYNKMFKLYSQTGQHAKVGTVFEDMERKGIPADIFTYSILIDAYSASSNINGIENVLERIKSTKFEMIWHIYATAAKAFSKVGMVDKALAALKKSEKFIQGNKGRSAYGFLLAIYSDMGIKDEIYRIWSVYKSTEAPANSVYMCMITSLLKIDDMEGAEAILKDWESCSNYYDFRVPNLLVSAYCKKGLVGKAESLVSRAIASGKTPFANTWDRKAGAYFKDNQEPKAVEAMKRALSASGYSTWKPNPDNVNASLDYFGVQKDVEAAEEFVGLLRGLGLLSREVYHHLLKAYMITGMPVSAVIDQMKADGFDADEETDKIVGSGNL